MTRKHWLAVAAACFVASMILTTVRLGLYPTTGGIATIDLACVALSGAGLLLLARGALEEDE